MKEKFRVVLETMHCQDNGTQDNVHQLSPEKRKEREIVFVDIAKDAVSKGEYKEFEDPTKVKSLKTGRGPLDPNDWRVTSQPIMCCYKLVSVEFKWLGIQNRVESFIHKTERRIFLNFHRQVFCWLDRWHGMTMKDIRELEDKTKRQLDEERNKGGIKGTKTLGDCEGAK